MNRGEDSPVVFPSDSRNSTHFQPDHRGPNHGSLIEFDGSGAAVPTPKTRVRGIAVCFADQIFNGNAIRAAASSGPATSSTGECLRWTTVPCQVQQYEGERGRVQVGPHRIFALGIDGQRRSGLASRDVHFSAL